MAANFWESNCAKQLVTRQRVLESHLEDRLRGVSEEQILNITSNCIHCIFELNSKANLRYRVGGTAVVYFRKFYLHQNFCEHDPRLVLVGCVYVATKAEESQSASARLLATYAKNLWRDWKFEAKHILDTEMVLMEVLDFNLIVYNPYRPLLQLIKDLEQQLPGLDAHVLERKAPLDAPVQDAKSSDSNPQDATATALASKSLARAAWSVMNDSYYCDASLMFPPHVVALGCLLYAATATTQLDILPWLKGLDVDLDQVYDAVSEIAHVYERNHKALSTEDYHRLLDFLLGKKS